MDKARTQYRLAIQNGSLKARSRLAWLYLIDEKEEKAEIKKQLANNADMILIQGKTDIDQLEPDQLTDTLDTQLDWYLAMALVRSRQERKDEALNYLSDAKSIKKEAENPNYQIYFFNCIQAEILQNHEKDKKQDIHENWYLCLKDNSLDLVHYFWQTKASEYFLKNPKKS